MTMPADNTPAIEAERLLPCPFCGADPLVNIIEPHSHGLRIGDWKMPDHEGSCVIECGCGAGLIDDTQAKVTARWNRRAPPAQAPEAVALTEDVRRDAERYRWLRDVSKGYHGHAPYVCIGMGAMEDPLTSGPDLDKAIDAARSSAPGSAVEVER